MNFFRGSSDVLRERLKNTFTLSVFYPQYSLVAIFSNILNPSQFTDFTNLTLTLSRFFSDAHNATYDE